MKRILTFLILLQSVALAGLAWQTSMLREQLNDFLLEAARQDDPGQLSESVTPRQVLSTNEVTLQQLRDVVRAEVRQSLAESLRDRPLYPAEQSPEMPGESLANPELAFSVSQTLEAHIAAGTMNDSDMASLQASIAQLHPDERTRILRRLVRAMNSGQLKARL